MLSRKAVISLRPPLYIAPNPEDFTKATKDWLAGRWHITHSTHPERYRGSEAWPGLISVSNGDEDTSTVTSGRTAIEKTTKLFPVSADPDSLSVVFLTDKSTTRKWEILAWGKEGQLESWMIEDGSGWISDSSGERRADWRNNYVVVFVSDTHDEAASGVEIWERFGPSRPLSNETVGKIRAALGEVAKQDEERVLGGLVERLRPVR